MRRPWLRRRPGERRRAMRGPARRSLPQPGFSLACRSFGVCGSRSRRRGSCFSSRTVISRRTLYLCDGRCGLTGCRMMARVATQALGLEFGETTQDGHIRLSSLRCRERDGSATVVMIDDDSQVIRHPAELRELIREVLPQVPRATTDAILEHARA